MSRLTSLSSLSLLALASLLPACGGDDDPGTESPDARPPSRPVDAGAPDAGATPTGVVSNLPVTWQAGPGSSGAIKILSSNFQQEVIGGDYVYQSWLAELRNDGTTPACLTKITLELQDASGRVIASMDTYAKGPAYKLSGSRVSSSCIPAGGTGALWTNDTPPSPAVLEQATRAVYTIEPYGGVSSAVPHPLAPQIEGTRTVRNQFDKWALQGTLRASAGTIYNIGVEAYAIGAQGWPLDRLSDTHLATLPQGQSWSFETLGADEQFSRSLTFTSFIEGSAGAVQLAPSEEPAFAAAASAAQNERDASEARLAERNQRRAQ